MARPADQSTKWDYEVEQLRMNHPKTGKVIENFFGNFRRDTGELLGTTTEQYGLVQNKELIDVALGALQKAGLSGWKQDIVVANKGRQIFAEFSFENKLLAKAVGDKFGYVFRVKNSFDRSIRAALVLAFKRLACLNGMETLEREYSEDRKHSSKISVDFMAEAIEKALKNGSEALKIYDRLAEKAVTDEKGLLILANLEDKGYLSGSLREPITTLWLAPRRPEDKPRNLYSLYNAVTEHLTHKVAPERYVYAQNTSRDILSLLVGASAKPELMKRLLTAPPKIVMSAAAPVNN